MPMRHSLHMSDKTPDVHAAYALETPEDHKRLYADWAEDYDEGFAKHKDYQLHIRTAQAFVDAGGRGPVLDAGAGTGLCGEALTGLGVEPIDATDISAEMLGQAMRKGIYRNAVEADLNRGIPVPPDSYSGIVSSGTFTLGHLGPEAFPALLRVAESGAQFALSINAKHFDASRFARALQKMERSQIMDLKLSKVRIYGDRSAGPNKDDIAYIALFRKV